MAVFTNDYVRTFASANSAFIDKVGLAFFVSIHPYFSDFRVLIQNDVVLFIARAYVHIFNLNAVKEEASSLLETV